MFTPLLESLSFEQAKDWAPWVGLSSEYVDRIKQDAPADCKKGKRSNFDREKKEKAKPRRLPSEYLPSREKKHPQASVSGTRSASPLPRVHADLSVSLTASPTVPV